MNLCDSCKKDGCKWRAANGEHRGTCLYMDPITRADLAARDAEIADLKRGGVVVVPESGLLPCPFCGGSPVSQPWHGGGPRKTMVCCENEECHSSPSVTEETPEEASRNWNMRAGLRPIPADRELMRLVDELIRWHGLRPLDKRPDHAAVLVGAIKALRSQPTQEPAT